MSAMFSIPYGGSNPAWIHNTTGGTSYVYGSNYWGNPTPYLMTYSAATAVTSGQFRATLGGTCIIGNLGQTSTCNSPPCRYEVMGSGSNFYLYKDGVSQYQFNPDWISCNPEYIYWGGYYSTVGYSDAIWGNTENKYVFLVPEVDLETGVPLFQIERNLLDPAASGFYSKTGTLISNTTFPSQFSKNNSVNQSINLQTYNGGVVYATAYTDDKYTGAINWNLTEFFAQNPEYGFYRITIPGSLKFSNPILYTASGSPISWDQDMYTGGDTGNINYEIPPSLWDTGTNNYRVDVMDLFGTISGTYTVTAATGVKSHDWETDDTGVFYAVLLSTPKAGGNDTWMGVAATELSDELSINGYVIAGETVAPVVGATVNITQVNTSIITSTDANGYYKISNLSADAFTIINVSAASYPNYRLPYNFSFTPLRTGGIRINVTLLKAPEDLPDPLSILSAGVLRDRTYGNPIPYATVAVYNETLSSYRTYTTNSVGYFEASFLENDTVYDMWASKPWYWNSSIYKVYATGIEYGGGGIPG